MSQGEMYKSGVGGMFVPPRYRQFVVTTADATVLVYSGIDVTPEDVFRRREVVYRKQWAKALRKDFKTPPAAFMDNYGDETVWSGDDLIAVCVPLMPGDGLSMLVYRFDKHDQGFERGRVWCRFRDPETPGPDVDDDEEHDPDEPTDGELAILKIVRGLGLSLEEACTALGRWSKDND